MYSNISQNVGVFQGFQVTGWEDDIVLNSRQLWISGLWVVGVGLNTRLKTEEVERQNPVNKSSQERFKSPGVERTDDGDHISKAWEVQPTRPWPTTTSQQVPDRGESRVAKSRYHGTVDDGCDQFRFARKLDSSAYFLETFRARCKRALKKFIILKIIPLHQNSVWPCNNSSFSGERCSIFSPMCWSPPPPNSLIVNVGNLLPSVTVLFDEVLQRERGTCSSSEGCRPQSAWSGFTVRSAAPTRQRNSATLRSSQVTTTSLASWPSAATSEPGKNIAVRCKIIVITIQTTTRSSDSLGVASIPNTVLAPVIPNRMGGRYAQTPCHSNGQPHAPASQGLSKLLFVTGGLTLQRVLKRVTLPAGRTRARIRPDQKSTARVTSQATSEASRPEIENTNLSSNSDSPRTSRSRVPLVRNLKTIGRKLLTIGLLSLKGAESDPNSIVALSGLVCCSLTLGWNQALGSLRSRFPGMAWVALSIPTFQGRALGPGHQCGPKQGPKERIKAILGSEDTPSRRQNAPRTLTPRYFEFLKLIGRGTFGKVFQVRKKVTKRIYAIKVLSKQEIVAKNEVEHTIGECKILQRLLECGRRGDRNPQEIVRLEEQRRMRPRRAAPLQIF
ncbi:hypothetical protein B0H11DRAFT_2197050 [Mycena galericulata]|nr:hypothetical protein B0H11DRAFT_2197050 [Mycena galericulata]